MRTRIVTAVKRLLLLSFVLAVAAGCGGGPPPSALQNRTFYQYDDLATSGAHVESPYPPLDQEKRKSLPAYVGVSVLGGSVHLSRPENWRIRRAGSTPTMRFIEYVSPNEYLFAIYERLDEPKDPWPEVLGRYEEDAKAKGAALVGQRVPIAAGNAQGRAYVVRRTVKGQRGAYTNTSREYVVRNDHRIGLVTILHQGETIGTVGDELLRVIDTFELN